MPMRKGPPATLTAEQSVCNCLIEALQKKLPQIIPQGETLRVFIWRELERGEKLHNRFVLSEVAGAMFGIGLDECEDEESAETEDVSRLTKDHLDFRWGQYSGGTPAFKLVRNPIEIIGKSEPNPQDNNGRLLLIAYMGSNNML